MFFLEHGTMKWKPLHYYAKRFFAPTLISVYEENNDIDVYMILDHVPVVENRHPDTSHLQFHIPFTTGLGLFQPISYQPSPSVTQNTITSVAMGTLYIEMYSWDSMSPLHTWTHIYSVSFVFYSSPSYTCMD